MSDNQFQAAADSVPTTPEPDRLIKDAAAAATAAAENGLSPARFGAMLLALGDPIDGEDEVVVILQRVVEIATEAIDGVKGAGITIALGGRVYTAVHTDERTLDVDAAQYAADDGPCLEAARTGAIVLVDVDESVERWPVFAAAARREGIQSFLAAPLRGADVTLGALNLYGTSRAAFDALDAGVLDVLTATAARAIGYVGRFTEATRTADGLRDAISYRAPIEQAKGMMMALHQIDADAAFSLLRKRSQDTNQNLRALCERFVEEVSAAG